MAKKKRATQKRTRPHSKKKIKAGNSPKPRRGKRRIKVTDTITPEPKTNSPR
jgi:hypothetical protein